MTGSFQRIDSTAAKREHIANEVTSQALSAACDVTCFRAAFGSRAARRAGVNLALMQARIVGRSLPPGHQSSDYPLRNSAHGQGELARPAACVMRAQRRLFRTGPSWSCTRSIHRCNYAMAFACSKRRTKLSAILFISTKIPISSRRALSDGSFDNQLRLVTANASSSHASTLA